MPAAADPTKTHELLKWKYTSPFISCRLDPLGRFAFAGAQDNTVQRFAIDDAAAKPVPLAAHDSWVRSINFSPDGATTYTGGFDGRLIWWETAAEKPEPVRTLLAHDGWLRSIAVSPDGAMLATSGNDNLVKLWNAADGELIRELAGHERHVYNCLFHPGGERLVSADLMGVVRDWNVADGTEVRQFKAEDLHKYDKTFRADIGGARCLAFDAEGTRLAFGGITNVTNAFAGVGNAAVAVLDWEKGEKQQLHKPKGNLRGVAWGVAFHPDGFLVVAAGGGSGGFLYFYKRDAANEFHQLKLPSQARDLHLHPDGIRLAVPFYDSHVRLYAMRAKEEAAKK